MLIGVPAEVKNHEYRVAITPAGVAEFAARGADGVFCHIDRAELEDDADMIIATVTPFASRGRR